MIRSGPYRAGTAVHEVLTRQMRDRRAVARYAGLTGAPDESGARRREQGLARAGNARVRRGMVQLAWRFLRFQKGSALALWYQARTADGVELLHCRELLLQSDQLIAKAKIFCVPTAVFGR